MTMVERPADSGETTQSARKRRAILDAATDVFLHSGYLGTNMDEIAARASVSKQTVYKHFATKEALFVEIVSSMTNTAGDTVHDEMPGFTDGADLAGYLTDYALRQLTIVLTPRIMQLRRLVIGEVPRFPELARVLYERGPMRALGMLATTFKQLDQRGLLAIDNPMQAASHFNWLIMSAPLNQAMLLGDDAIPSPSELRRHAQVGVRVFMIAYSAGADRTEKRG